MFTVDQLALNASIAKWNGYLAGKIDLLHASAQSVIRTEASRLVQTLIKFTPPVNRTVTNQKIVTGVHIAFAQLSQSSAHKWEDYTSTAAGKGDVRWYAVTPKSLYGLKKEADKTQASAEELYRLYSSLTKGKKKTRIIAGHRGRQTVYLTQKITTDPAAYKNLITRLQRHVGRLKAGWLPAWEKLGRPRGTYAPPGWVTRHASGARGYAVSGLGDPRYPQFTLENHAAGAGSALMASLVHRALETRSKAMVQRMKFLLQHPEKIKEELS